MNLHPPYSKLQPEATNIVRHTANVSFWISQALLSSSSLSCAFGHGTQHSFSYYALFVSIIRPLIEPSPRACVFCLADTGYSRYHIKLASTANEQQQTALSRSLKISYISIIACLFFPGNLLILSFSARADLRHRSLYLYAYACFHSPDHWQLGRCSYRHHHHHGPNVVDRKSRQKAGFLERKIRRMVLQRHGFSTFRRPSSTPYD